MTAVGYVCALSGTDGGAAGLTLTGELSLHRRTAIVDPAQCRAGVTFLALADRPVFRMRLAGALWTDGSGDRAARSLRTALWRIRQVGANLVLARDDRLRLYPG